MNNSGQKIKRILQIALALQAFIMIFLLILSFTRKKAEFTYTPDSFTDNVTPYTSLRAGSYDFTIHFKPVDFKHTEIAGTYVIMDDDYVDNALVGNLVGYYTQYNTEVYAPFWLYHSTDEMRAKIVSDNEIENVTIKETNALLYEFMVYLVMLFAVADFILYRMIKKKSSEQEDVEIKNNKVALIIFATTCILSLPLMIHYLLDGHDLGFHLMRIEGIKENIMNLRFPARMNSYALEGQGYADTIFYPYFFLYIPAFLRVLGLPILRAYKIFIAILNLAGCIISFKSFKSITKSTKAAIVGMIVYNLAPYHTACLYSRGALGEAIAYIFIPLIALGTFKLLSKKPDLKECKKAIIALTVGFSGILQSHILSLEMTGLMLILCLIICAKRSFRIKTIVSYVIAGIMTLGLNMWFIVPFVQSMKLDLFVFNQMDLFLNENALNLYQLFSARQALYGYSNYLSFSICDEIGISLGLAIPLGLLLIMYEFRKLKGSIKNDTGKALIVSLIMGTVTAWMTTYFFPWDKVEVMPVVSRILGMVQYVWRYLGISTFSFSLSLALFISTLDFNKTEKNIKPKFYSIILIALSVLLFYPNVESLIKKTEIYSPYSNIDRGRMMVQAEYLFSGYTDEIVREGIVVDTPYTRDRDKYIFHVNNTKATEAVIETPLTYYPYYIVENTVLNTKSGLGMTEFGTSYFTVPAGFSGDVRVYVPETRAWIAGDIVAVLSLVVLIAFAISDTFMGGKRKNSN